MGKKSLSQGPGLVGKTELCMVSERGYLTYRNIDDFHRLWQHGTREKLPPPPGKGYAWVPKLSKWKAAVTHQGEQRYLGLFLDEDAAKQAVQDFRDANPCHRTRKMATVKRNHVRCVDETTLIAARGGILDVRELGRARTVRITTRSGHSLACSPGQIVLTPAGRRRADELTVGECVLITGRTVFPSERLIPPSLRRGIGVWTSMQRDRLIADIDHCYLCGGTYQRTELVLDHEIPVVLDLLKALDVRNLKPACEPCHRVKSNSEQSLGKRNGSTSVGKGDAVTHITSEGTEMLYHLIVADPWHNYLANRIFVTSSTE